MKLTEKQKEFLAYISQYMEDWGRSPSFEEICSHFGFSSYNTVTTYLKALERKGYVRQWRPFCLGGQGGLKERWWVCLGVIDFNIFHLV